MVKTFNVQKKAIGIRFCTYTECNIKGISPEFKLF
jgi:hypothetical protein